MASDGLISFSMDDVTLGLLLITMGIFALLAAKSKEIKSFQFQISIFIIIMIIGEIINILPDDFTQIPSNFEEIGYLIHLSSMIFFSLMLWLRFYYSKKSGKKMIENIVEDV